MNGLWAALDSATGRILWETPSPLGGAMAVRQKGSLCLRSPVAYSFCRTSVELRVWSYKTRYTDLVQHSCFTLQIKLCSCSGLTEFVDASFGDTVFCSACMPLPLRPNLCVCMCLHSVLDSVATHHWPALNGESKEGFSMRNLRVARHRSASASTCNSPARPVCQTCLPAFGSTDCFQPPFCVTLET